MMVDLLGRVRVLDGLAAVGAVRARLERRRRGSRRAAAQRAEFYREAWTSAAEAVGASSRALDGDLLEISRGETRVRVLRNYTFLDDAVSLRVAGDKPLVLRLLGEAGLPVTEHCAFRARRVRPAVEFLERATGPCVVKPARGTGAGQGVTTGVRGAGHLVRAILAAGVLPWKPLLIERQVPGDNYRLLFLDGELLEAVRRGPPTVRGDGTSTVRELIRAANEERLARGYDLAQTVIEIDRELRRTIEDGGLTLGSVPEDGREVVLRTSINSNSADENEVATGAICAEIVEEAAAAARVVGARLAGVDIITPDPSRSLAQAGGVVLEVNTTPGFHFHYHRRGEPLRVAERVLETVFDSRLEPSRS